MSSINKDKKYPKHVFNPLRPGDFNPGCDNFDTDEQAALAMCVFQIAKIHDVALLDLLGELASNFAGKTVADYPALGRNQR